MPLSRGPARFQPGLVPTLFALAAFLLLASLGVWQLRRHAWRQEWLAARNAQLDRPPAPIAEVLADPKAFTDRRATARGRWLHAESIAARDPEGGARVLTPLALAPPAPPDAPVVLVDRGRVPGPQLDAFLEADVAAPDEEIEVAGRLFPLSLQPVAPGSAPEVRREWLRFDPARPDAVAALQAQLSRPLASVGIEAGEGAPGALPRGGLTRPVSPVDHVAYAVFWFALSLAAAGNWVAFGFYQAQQARRAADRGMLPPRAAGAQERGEDP